MASGGTQPGGLGSVFDRERCSDLTQINLIILPPYQHMELLTGKDPQAKMPSLFARLKNCIQYTF
jgi:hypothetical protein